MDPCVCSDSPYSPTIQKDEATGRLLLGVPEGCEICPISMEALAAIVAMVNEVTPLEGQIAIVLPTLVAARLRDGVATTDDFLVVEGACGEALGSER
jgi:hypothetical protein